MIYGSVCSGIEAATVAWEPLGWRPAFFAEIEAFPSAVLKHHYPDVSNVGDFTGLIHAAAPVPSIDVLVGGTPCQSFSVAGLRRGLADARGGLTLEFVRLAQRLRPRWIVWENVPGVLSQDGGRAFGAFLGALGELGYGWAYRVLDAQYFGVAQRRRRVFVVGCAGGDFARAAAVLFEPEGVQRHSAPSREAGQTITRGVEIGPSGGRFADVNPTLDAGAQDGPIRNQLAGAVITMAHGQGGAEVREDGARSLTCNHEAPIVFSDSRLNGQDAYTGRVLPVAFDARQSDTIVYGESTGPLDTDRHSMGVCVPGDRTHATQSDVAGPLDAHYYKGPGSRQGGEREYVAQSMSVRRLTPVECERLQGFPDDYTRIPWKGKPASECPDGPRYKALGNSMAVPVMRWIGERIAMVEAV